MEGPLKYTKWLIFGQKNSATIEKQLGNLLK
jgi:hypothetical protein